MNAPYRVSLGIIQDTNKQDCLFKKYRLAGKPTELTVQLICNGFEWTVSRFEKSIKTAEIKIMNKPIFDRKALDSTYWTDSEIEFADKLWNYLVAMRATFSSGEVVRFDQQGDSIMPISNNNPVIGHTSSTPMVTSTYTCEFLSTGSLPLVSSISTTANVISVPVASSSVSLNDTNINNAAFSSNQETANCAVKIMKEHAGRVFKSLGSNEQVELKEPIKYSEDSNITKSKVIASDFGILNLRSNKVSSNVEKVMALPANEFEQVIKHVFSMHQGELLLNYALAKVEEERSNEPVVIEKKIERSFMKTFFEGK